MFHLKAEICRISHDTNVDLSLSDLTSGVHFSGIFSNESGESTEKHIRMTSVSG